MKSLLITDFVNKHFDTFEELDEALKSINLYDDSFVRFTAIISYSFTPKNMYSSYEYYCSISEYDLLKYLEKAIKLKAFL